MSQKKFYPLAKPVLGKEEEKAVITAMRSGWITLGPKTGEFEQLFAKYIGCKYAVAVNSATAALHLALFDLGMKPGDEVIIPAFTFAATANTVIHSKGTPVLADIDPLTFCIDPEDVRRKITKRTKAIVPVHYAGNPANMNALKKIAKEFGLAIIEDAATAVGTLYRGKKIGVTSDYACFSFHPIKNMTTGDGGMVTTNDKKKAERMTYLRLQGMNKLAWKRFAKGGSWKYDIVAPGFKYNMTDISAAMGIEQLKKLDGFNKRREKIVSLYKKELSDLDLQFQAVDSRDYHSNNLFALLLPKSLAAKRDNIIDELKTYNIGANVYYIPLHFHPYYQEAYGWKKGMAPVTEEIFSRLVNLPLYSSLSDADVKSICKSFHKVLSHL
jgi:dTDP-4-amino-4,6-dideoxygalactose transaminase